MHESLALPFVDLALMSGVSLFCMVVLEVLGSVECGYEVWCAFDHRHGNGGPMDSCMHPSGLFFLNKTGGGRDSPPIFISGSNRSSSGSRITGCEVAVPNI
jgi:hypothetical protein